MKNMNIELVEITDRSHGNLLNTPHNVLKRQLGKYAIIHAGGNIGTVRQISTGKCFDWWICDDQTVCVEEAQ